MTDHCFAFRDTARQVVKASRRMTAAVREASSATTAFVDAFTALVQLLRSDSAAAVPLWSFANFA
jgi:hypothetical protein